MAIEPKEVFRYNTNPRESNMCSGMVIARDTIEKKMKVYIWSAPVHIWEQEGIQEILKRWTKRDLSKLIYDLTKIKERYGNKDDTE